MHRFSRMELLIGSENLHRLSKARVAIFGVGGVGAFAAEGLARAGVGYLTLVDHDEIALTNINRQLHATERTVGMAKVEVMRARILDINPAAKVDAMRAFYLPETAESLFGDGYDYVVDAIDTVAGKIDLAVRAESHGVPIVSSMGAGNKLDPTCFEVADIYETSVCPLAKVMRKELRARGVKRLKVVYSKEAPLTPIEFPDGETPAGSRRSVPGSISFVPSVVGLIVAGVVVGDLIGRPIGEK